MRAEIWGHSNFHDARLPALRIKSLRGLGGLVAVTSCEDISENWLYRGTLCTSSGEAQCTPAGPAMAWPLVSWGGWISDPLSRAQCYSRRLVADGSGDSWILHFSGAQSPVRISVNGSPCIRINPLNPYVDISPWMRAERSAEIMLSLDPCYRQGAGKVMLFTGHSVNEWSVTGAGEADLWASAAEAAKRPLAADLPYTLSPGAMAWLWAELSGNGPEQGCWTAHCHGRNAKIAAFLNGRLIGRLWLPSPGRPRMAGGSEDMLYLPGPWFEEEGNRLAFLLEAVVPSEDAELTSVTFQEVPARLGSARALVEV